MYEKYISINTIPAGTILKRIVDKEHINQKQLSEKSGIIAQRLNDYIKGKRKFTPTVSFQLENALGITTPGYFYIIQTQYEITQAKNKIELLNHPNIDTFRKALFWDTHIEKINWISNKNWVMQRVFEYGNELEIKEIIAFYGKEIVKTTIKNIHSTWKKDIRESNFKTYLEHE
jgi:plasmid maintenance system antidote protein VapI